MGEQAGRVPMFETRAGMPRLGQVMKEFAVTISKRQSLPRHVAVVARCISMALIAASVWLPGGCGGREKPERDNHPAPPPSQATTLEASHQPTTAETPRRPANPEASQLAQAGEAITHRPAWMYNVQDISERQWQRQLSETEYCSVYDWQAFLKDPSALALMPKLRGLSIRGPHFTDQAVDVLNRFPQVTLVTIGDHRQMLTPDDMKGLGRLRHVSELVFLPYNLTDDDLAPLGQLHCLKRLQLSRCDAITGAGLSPLKSVEELVVDGNSLTEEGLASLRDLPNLRQLGFGRFEPTDAVLGYLRGHAYLRVLGLRGARVTDAGLANLEGMVNLEHLSLPNLQSVTSTGLAHLSRLKRLRILNLEGAPIDSSGLSYLADLHHLEKLYLRGADIDANALDRLTKLPNLADLNLSRTGIGDKAMGAIAGMTSLRRLVLNWTSVTDDGVRRIAALPRLEEIDLSCTRITNVSFDSLGKLPRLKRLWVYGSRVVDDNRSFTRQLPGNGAEVMDWMDLGVGYDTSKGLLPAD